MLVDEQRTGWTAMTSNQISKANPLKSLCKGIQRAYSVIAQVTDYHGGPITTEYMLTSDIGRELIEQNYDVRIEYANRRMVNSMTRRADGVSSQSFGSQRADIAVLRDHFSPLAIIEVKIGVKTLRSVRGDLSKMVTTIDALKPQYASQVWGVSIFQVHVKGSPRRRTEAHLRRAFGKTLNRLHRELRDYARTQTSYKFGLHSLQTRMGGIVPTEIEEEFDGSRSLGRDGHVTRYYAIIIRSLTPIPQQPLTFSDMKAQSQGHHEHAQGNSLN